MNFKEHRKDFNRRWNITSSENLEEAFKQFKQRILNFFKNYERKTDHSYNISIGIDEVITKKGIEDFCQNYCIELQWKSRMVPGMIIENYGSHIIDYMHKEHTEKEFYRLIEVIFSLEFENDFQGEIKSTVINKVKEIIENSDVNVSIGQNKNGQFILYPKGEKKLDEELVNKTFLFLNDKSNKHFEEALKFYQNKYYVMSAENLRRSLEEFLRYKLNNQKGLDKNITILQNKLKQENNQPEIRNIIFHTFNSLDKYFNEYSKHGYNVKEPENEFLIYQAGLLMRYIDKIDNFQKKQ